MMSADVTPTATHLPSNHNIMCLPKSRHRPAYSHTFPSNKNYSVTSREMMTGEEGASDLLYIIGVWEVTNGIDYAID